MLSGFNTILQEEIIYLGAASKKLLVYWTLNLETSYPDSQPLRICIPLVRNHARKNKMLVQLQSNSLLVLNEFFLQNQNF